MPSPRNPDKRKCAAHISSGPRKGEPCQKWANRGATVCRSHGGSAPRIKQAAARNQAANDIRRALGKLNITPVRDPLTALSELAGEILAWKELAAARVATLQDMAARNFATGSDEVHAEIQVFERAMDRAVSVLGTIARLNIDERLAAINEAQAALVRDILMGSLADAGLGTEVQREVAGHVSRRLRLVPRRSA
jgi:hypothetical protein